MSLALAFSFVVGQAGAADNSWKGTTDALWSTSTNWNNGHTPTSTETVRFDQLSTSNLTMNNDLTGVSIVGIANTSLAANNGPAGPMTIQGNAITIGSSGIDNGSGNPKDYLGYTGPAQADLTVDVDLALSADQRWKMGGPGTGTTAQAGGQQSVIVGASANGHTVSLNGFKPTLTVISNAFDMIIVNSKLVDGSVPSKVGISKVTGTTTTFSLDSGNINATPRIRISGDSTYSGGTDIIGGRQLIQIATSSVTGVSGPFGRGPITINTESLVTGTINNQNPYFSPYLADRTIDNDINLNPMITNTGGTPTQSFPTLYNSGSTDDATLRTLTLNGVISVPATAVLVENNALGTSNNKNSGAGDAVINGTILLGGADFNSDGVIDAGDYVSWRKNPAAHGGADGYKSFRENFGNTISGGVTTTGTFTVGQNNGAPTFTTGKQTFNGNIVQTNNATYTVVVNSGDATRPAVVQLGGQNTFGAMTVNSAAGSNTAGDANVKIASNSTLSGPTIVSGPLGTGTVTITSAGGSSFEAVGAARTVANPFALSTNQSQLQVQGSQDLTLNGVISGNAGLAMNGTAKLILGGANTYVGGATGTTINSGTVLVNGSIVSAVTVNATGTVGGTGTISNTITNNGTIAPGASIGTLNVTGDVTDQGTSSWAIELSGTSSDLLAVTGNINLSGTDNVAVTGAGTGASWIIATYTGALSGTFGSVTSGYSLDYGTVGQIILRTPGSGAGGGLGNAAVPEPGALGLAAIAIGSAIGFRRRRS